MRCPKSCGTMFEEMDSFVCWTCSTRVWKQPVIAKPMDAKEWRKHGNGKRKTIDSRRECRGCHEIKPINTADDLCWKCDDRRKKGRPFEGEFKPGRNPTMRGATL